MDFNQVFVFVAVWWFRWIPPRLCIRLFWRDFKVVKSHKDCASTITDDWHYGEAEAEEVYDCIRLGNDLRGGCRSNIAEGTETG